MAKNSYKANVNQYANQEEAIRKAKGNPNKNIHSKKKNSNYGGYTTGAYMAQKVAEKVALRVVGYGVQEGGYIDDVLRDKNELLNTLSCQEFCLCNKIFLWY